MELATVYICTTAPLAKLILRSETWSRKQAKEAMDKRVYAMEDTAHAKEEETTDLTWDS